MKPSPLIFAACIIALTLFGCPPPPTALRLAGAPVCDASGNLNPVPFLAQPFTPGEPYDQSPQPDLAPINGDIQSDLTAAFNAAPPFFKAQLCGLKGIYVNQKGCTGYDPSTCNLSDSDIAANSWGFRKYPTGEEYIAISLGLWKNDASNPWPCPGSQRICAPPFQTYQTRLLGTLLKTLAPSVPPNPHPPQFVNVSPNTGAMSVLATLAHEFGHIYWYDAFVIDPSTGAPNPGGPAVTTRFCGGTFYPPGSWSRAVDVPLKRFIEFGQLRDQPAGSEILQVQSSLGRGDFPHAGDHLHNIYANGRWASALAAFSPDEEFVEIFELFVLTNANPSETWQVQIYGHRPDPIPHPPKTRCFQQALCPTCPP
jgi:hypothetical protein